MYVPNVFRYYVRRLVERNTYTKYDGYNAVITVCKIQYMGLLVVKSRRTNLSHSFKNRYVFNSNHVNISRRGGFNL